jgi:aromatic-amino-acid transaminase
LSEAEKYDLETLPYCGGFFISVPTNSKNIFKDLVDDHVFVIPMQNIIRIAISSLNIKDVPELVRKIKKHI